MWWLVALAAIVVVLSPGAAAASPDDGYPGGPPSQAGRAELDLLLSSLDLHPELHAYLIAVAYTESRFRSGARNDSAGEVAAGRRLFDGALERGYFAGNDHAAEFRAFGSGGWFGFLAATGLAAGGPDGPFALSAASMVQDPRASVVMAVDYCSRLRRYDSFRAAPYWGTLRLGWASLATMAAPQGERAQATLARFASAVRATGGPSDLATRRVVGLDDYAGPEDLLRRLGA